MNIFNYKLGVGLAIIVLLSSCLHIQESIKITPRVNNFAKNLNLKPTTSDLNDAVISELKEVSGIKIHKRYAKPLTFRSPEGDTFVFLNTRSQKNYLWIQSGNGAVLLSPLEGRALMNFVSDTKRRNTPPEIIRKIIAIHSSKPDKPLAQKKDGARRLFSDLAIFDFAMEAGKLNVRVLNSDDQSEAWRQSLSAGS